MGPADDSIFTLNPEAYELTRGRERVKLERLTMELLLLLVERKGLLVTRQEIAERLWRSDVFVDVETGINTAIRKLRKAFGGESHREEFIETLTGKGYRFAGPIQVIQAASSARPPDPVPSGQRAMLAVLPFVNLSSDPEQEYFTDGLTEETISYLGQVDPARMGVIARTSIMAYKNTSKDISQIGRELAVDYVLESSSRREGQRVRITAQLIRVADQTHLWAETYDRDVISFLSLQAEIAKAIASEVQLKLENTRSAITSTEPSDLKAYELYLRGKYYWNRFSHRQGIECFLQAIERDPNYAPSHAGLANCLSALPLALDEPVLEIRPRALEAAKRAVEIDRESASAQASLGIARMWLEWDWKGSLRAFRRALELNPSDVDARMHYAHLLSGLGQHKDAVAEMSVAQQLDPLSPNVRIFSAIVWYHARIYDSALTLLHDALALNPHVWLAHLFLGKVYERKGQAGKALQAFQTAYEAVGGNTELISLRGYVFAKEGNKDEAGRAQRMLMEMSARKYVPPYNQALVCAGSGETGDALRWLERAYETRDVRMIFLAVESKWDSFRGHPQFQDLLRRVGLPVQVLGWDDAGSRQA